MPHTVEVMGDLIQDPDFATLPSARQDPSHGLRDLVKGGIFEAMGLPAVFDKGPKWEVDYENDTGHSDEGFWEWYSVHNKDYSLNFDCKNEKSAEWLCNLLNKYAGEK